MWIVRLALRRPYTFVVLSILILIMGGLAILRTPTDIFPNINIPVVSIIWNYNGLVPEDMSDRIVSVTERSLTTTVDNIEHIESQSLYGVAVIKVFLQPTANIQQGIAQVTAISQTQLRQLPAGTTPPLILAYSASSVPVLQLALSGHNLSEQQLNDYGLNFIRTQLITVPGASVPYPYGGKQRQVQVDLNTTALQSKGLSALDVVNAISAQNLILPTGTSKIGSKEYNVYFYQNDVSLKDVMMKVGVYPMPLGTPGISAVDTRDIAEAAAIALTSEGHLGKTYNLNGPEILSGKKIASLWSGLLGKEIRYPGEDLDSFEEQMRQSAPSWSAFDIRMMFQGYLERGFAAEDGDIETLTKLLGHPPRRYEDFAKETVRAWQMSSRAATS